MVKWNGMMSEIYSTSAHLLITTTCTSEQDPLLMKTTLLYCLHCMADSGHFQKKRPPLYKDHNFLRFKLLSCCLACILMMSNCAPYMVLKCADSPVKKHFLNCHVEFQVSNIVNLASTCVPISVRNLKLDDGKK